MNDLELKARVSRLIAVSPSPEPDVNHVRRRATAKRSRRRMIVAATVLSLGVLSVVPPSQPLAGRAVAAVLRALTGAGGGTAPPPSFTPTPGSQPGWVEASDPNYLVTVQTPATWTFVSDPTPNMTDPRILFVNSSYPVTSGECSWLTSLPADGAVVWVEEWFHLTTLGGSPDSFPPKPDQVVLTPDEIGNFVCGANSSPQVYTVMFQISGRYFWAYVALGDSAAPSLKQYAETVLSSMTAQPLST